MTKIILRHSKTVLFLFIGLLVSACEHNTLSNNSSQNSINSAFDIDTFSVIPPEIDGCACYFSNNEKEFKENKYIYADDHGNNAFLSINGVVTKFKIIKSDTFPAKHSIEVWTNDKYELIIDTKQVGQIDETWQEIGTLRITTKEGKTITKNIYGECGC